MIDTTELLVPDRVRCNEPVQSKKRALELGATLLADAVPGMSRMDIFEALNTRERLGSTGLGHGVALPHARVAGTDRAVAACLTLAEPIDFDAPDRERVDILFLLLVPSECSDRHLQILAELAETFSNTEVREQVRADTDPETLVEHLGAGGGDGDREAQGVA